jgi:hypothetical protein
MENKKIIFIISILISVFSIILLVLHLLFPTAAIDPITITLFLIAIVPWVGSIFKSIKLPGGFQVDYQELREISKELKDTGLISEPLKKQPYGESTIRPYEESTTQSLNPSLQLANLRIEIEKRIRHFAELQGIVDSKKPLSRVISDLYQLEAFSRDEFEVLRQLLRILNSAVHGKDVEEPVFLWAMDEGPLILAGLDSRIKKKSENMSIDFKLTSANPDEFPWSEFKTDRTALQKNQQLKIYKIFNQPSGENIAFILCDYSGPATIMLPHFVNSKYEAAITPLKVLQLIHGYERT